MSTYLVEGEGRQEVSVVTRVRMPWKGAAVQVSTSRGTTRLGSSHQAGTWITPSCDSKQTGQLLVKLVHCGDQLVFILIYPCHFNPLSK